MHNKVLVVSGPRLLDAGPGSGPRSRLDPTFGGGGEKGDVSMHPGSAEALIPNLTLRRFRFEVREGVPNLGTNSNPCFPFGK